MSGTLFVVATPIGNLQDLAPRAAETLAAVAVVAAEDTRHTRKLLAHLDAHPELVSVHQHTPAPRIAALVERLRAGEQVALVTDAGTPSVSDPGGELVRAARAAGIRIVPLPGPSAVAAALSVAGLPADRYRFLGFPPRKGPERRAWLATAARESPETVVLFEAANRLVALLTDLGEVAGDGRQAVVGRELTKLHEEIKSGTLNELAAYYVEHPARGEVTVVMAGNQRPEEGQGGQAIRAVDVARRLIAAGLTKRDVTRVLQETMQLSRNAAYQIVTALDA